MEIIRLSEHFTANEFVCRCGKCDLSKPDIIKKVIHPVLVEKLEEFRLCIGKPVIVSSGARCKEHHMNIYKSRYGNDWKKYITWESKHLINERSYFEAGDIQPVDTDYFNAGMLCAYLRFNCVGWYQYESGKIIVDYFIHTDVGFRKTYPHLIFYKKIYKNEFKNIS